MDEVIGVISSVDFNEKSVSLISAFVERFDETLIIQHDVVAKFVKVVSFFRAANEINARTYVAACFLLAKFKKHFVDATVNTVFKMMGYSETQ